MFFLQYFKVHKVQITFLVLIYEKPLDRKFSVWTGSSLFGQEVLCLDRKFSVWTGSSPFGQEVLCLDRKFSVWTGSSPFGQEVLCLDGIITCWERITQDIPQNMNNIALNF